MVIKSVLSVLILLFSLTGFSQNKDVKVHKEYDEDGNLIRYDSTYVYIWSSDSTYHFPSDSSFFNFSDIHEMRKKMQEQMENLFNRDSAVRNSFQHPFFSDDFFNSNFFQNDSFSRDSSHNNFFKEMEEMMDGRMNFDEEQEDKMHQNLDSLHNEFIKKQKKDSTFRKQKKEQDKSINL
jgi:DNA primase